MVILHADDYGIDLEQARSILELCARPGASGLSSVSIFVNSPHFHEAAQLAAPRVEAGDIDMSLHFNLVEGPSCADPANIPLLVNERGMFKNDFVKLLQISLTPKRGELQRQIRREASAQIQKYLQEFPQQREGIRIDSHQHTHMVPVVFDGLLEALEENGCTLRQMRFPTESKAPYLDCGFAKDISTANKVKNVLLNTLGKKNRGKLSQPCVSPAFSGVLLSGSMDKVSKPLIDAMASAASARGEDIEVLFHPVTVPIARCLDPDNMAFAQACASPSRDAEARTIRVLTA